MTKVKKVTFTAAGLALSCLIFATGCQHRGDVSTTAGAAGGTGVIGISP